MFWQGGGGRWAAYNWIFWGGGTVFGEFLVWIGRLERGLNHWACCGVYGVCAVSALAVTSVGVVGSGFPGCCPFPKIKVGA